MPEEIIPKTEKRSLRYDYPAKELHDVSVQLAHKNRELVSIEEEKKSVSSQYTARINETKATINKLSGTVSDGFDMRDIECSIEFNKPKPGEKMIIRLDQDKIIATEKMSEWEWNLFNQPNIEVSDMIEEAKENLRGNGKKRNKKKPR